MASDSISSLVLFIAAMLVAAGVAGTLVTNVNELSNSIEGHSVDVREKIDTDVEIISDPGSDAVYDESDGDGTITLYVKNTGERTLSSDPSALDVLVDGRYVSRSALNVTVLESESESGTDDGPSPWRRGTVAELEIAQELESGEHRVVVDVGGDRETFEFYLYLAQP